MTEYLSAFLLGLISAGHCLGMCGGLMLAAGFASRSTLLTLAYNAGRLTTYLLLGIVFGFSSSLLPAQTLPILKFLSALLLLLSALYFLGKSQLLTRFEQIGLPLWRVIQPHTQRLLPITSVGPAYCIGLAWGLIPCGLVYTALAFSLASGQLISTTLRMLCFGLGTLPMMLTVSIISTPVNSLLRQAACRYLVAALLAISAGVIFISALKEL